MARTDGMTTVNMIAGADMSALQYRIVIFNATGVDFSIEKDTSATLDPVGVIQNDPTSGNAAAVAISGFCKLELGGTVDAGDYITSDSVGRGIATTTAGNNVVGQIMEDGISGDIRTLLVDKQTIHA